MDPRSAARPLRAPDDGPLTILGLTSADILTARPADDVLAFTRAGRTARR